MRTTSLRLRTLWLDPDTPPEMAVASRVLGGPYERNTWTLAGPHGQNPYTPEPPEPFDAESRRRLATPQRDMRIPQRRG